MIHTLAALPPENLATARAGIEQVFFQCSEGGAALEGSARAAFLRDWCGVYLDRWPEDALIHAGDAGPCDGYLVGCLDTRAAAPALRGGLFYLDAFADFYDAYPAHFHVNVRPACQGRGVGGDLVAAFAARCAEAGCAGLHLVTGAFARNRAFYRRCGFEPVARRRVRGRALVLMGRTP